jgi:hypothetical protein
MFSSEAWLANPGANFYNGVITSSCRFNGTSSKLVSPAFASDLGNTWTWSAWVKFTNQTSDRRGSLFNAVGESASLYFDNTSQDFLSVNDDGAVVCSTSRLLRDPSSWYHIVLNGNGTINKLWINGQQATFGTNPNVDGINIAVAHQIGGSTFGANYLFDGIMADINFVSQTALDYTAFAEEKNGVLIPKEPSVTYGANGFRLQFKQTGSGADASGIGADTSGNNKHFTATGLGAYDVLPDSPENNFSTWNALFTGGEQSPDGIYTAPVLSNGNLEVSLGGNSYMGNNFRPTSGKWYAEIRLKTLGSTNGEVTWGWLVANTYVGNRTGNPPLADLFSANWLGYSSTGNILRLFDETSQLGSNITTTVSAGNILQLALDIDNNKGFIGINNAWAYSGNLSGGNPATGANPTFTFTDDEVKNLQFYVANGTSTDVYVANFGQDSTFGGDVSAGGNADGNGIGDFAYVPPSDFLALCSANLPEQTIGPNSTTQADDYFNTLIYDGNDDATRTFDVGFVSDWSWFKARNASGIGHQLYDSSRGVQKYLATNTLTGDSDNTEGVTSFNSSGLLAIGNSNFLNKSGRTHVLWNWKAGGATPTKTYKVVVVSDSGNKYRFRNSADSATFAQSAVALNLQEGGTYTFDWSDSTATSHPFRFSTTSDGTHGGGSEYTTGVVKDDTAKTITITVASSAPTLYYYCSAHSGMGGQVNTNTTHGQTNFDGSILSVSQANTTSGFSIALYTGTGANATVGHGVQVNGVATAPRMIIMKNRDSSQNWVVYHEEIGNDREILFNTTGVQTNSNSVYFQSTSPTSTVFSLGSDNYANASTDDYVAYCFAEVEGYSRFGSFAGNTSTDGTFVALNFSPAMVIVKRATGSSTYDWFIHDNKRGAFNVNDERLAPNASDQESTSITSMDFLSNGFKIKTANTSYNEGSVIYMAFAEAPFKYANAR